MSSKVNMGKMKITLEAISSIDDREPLCIQGELATCILTQHLQEDLSDGKAPLYLKGIFNLDKPVTMKSVPSYIERYLIPCKHKDTKLIDWPDNSQVEICQDCGRSRNLWEQGASNWIMIKDIYKAKNELRNAMSVFHSAQVKNENA